MNARFRHRLLAPAALLVSVSFALSSCGSREEALRYNRAHDPQPEHMREVATSAAMPSTSAEVLDNGPALRRKMVELIDSAEDYILITTFLLGRDAATEEVLQALRRRHQAGVRIFVIADSSSLYRPGGKAGFRFLREAGIAVAEYNPMRVHKIVVGPVMLRRDHRKVWIIDGKTVLLGGANLYYHSLRPPEQGGHRDLMMAVESPKAAAWMIDSFVASWNANSRHKVRRDDFRVPPTARTTTSVWIADQNKDIGRDDVMPYLFGGLFALARREVWLVQAYALVNPTIIAQIREMTERGVRVHVVVSEQVESPRFRFGTLYGAKDILEAGGNVWIYRAPPEVLHSKAILVDDRWASVGSANLNYRSYYLSNEANLTFGDPPTVARIRLNIEELRRHCHPVSMTEAKRYRSPEYFLVWLFMQFTG